MNESSLHPWTPRLLWLVMPSLLGAAIWWYVVEQVLHGRLAFTTAGLPALLLMIVFGFFSLGLWLGAAGLTAYFGSWHSVRLAVAAAVCWPVCLFFPLTAVTVGVFLGLILVVWWGIERVASDAINRTQIKPHFTFGGAMPLIILLVMVGVSVLYYQQLRGSSKTADELSQSLASQTVSVIERFLPIGFDDYKSDMTVDELIGSQVPSAAQLLADIDYELITNADERERMLRDRLSQIDNLDVGSLPLDFTQPQAQLEQALDDELVNIRAQLSTAIRDNLSTQFGVPIAGDATVHQMLTDMVNKQFTKYISRYVAVIPWLLSFALFFVLRIFSGFFQIFTNLLATVLLWLYRHLRIIHVVHETVPAERVDWCR